MELNEPWAFGDIAFLAILFFWPLWLFLSALLASALAQVFPRRLGWLALPFHLVSFAVDSGAFTVAAAVFAGPRLFTARAAGDGPWLTLVELATALLVAVYIFRRHWIIYRYQPRHLDAYLATWGA